MNVLFSARRKDFRIETFCAGGPGGQHQNRKETAVRITHTHIETGLAAEAREHRSQHQNLKAAFRRLAQRLVTHVLGEQRKQRWPGSSEVVRTYHAVDNRVTDKASGLQQPYGNVLHDPAQMIEARRKCKKGT